MLVFDTVIDSEYPKRYRCTYTIDKTFTPIMLASGQFNEEQLKTILKQVAQRIYVVDLRQEIHFHTPEIAISDYSGANNANLHKDNHEILAAEKDLAKQNSNQQITIATKKTKTQRGYIDEYVTSTIETGVATTESELLQKFEIPYKRFFVTDHLPPDKTTVEEFIAWLKSLDKDFAIYFHCRGGSGRTSTFMLMTDIYFHAKNLSLADIYKRQISFGSKDLRILPDKNNYLYNGALARKLIIEQLYHDRLNDNNR